MKGKLRGIKILLVVSLLAGFLGTTWAAEFPEKPIEILLPYGAAAGSATVNRVMAEIMSKELPKPVILTPAVGAGGSVAGEKIAKRTKPDGYTLIQVNSGTNCVALYTKKDITYTENDFTYLVQTHASYIGLVAAPNAPFKTVEEFLDYARKNPNSVKHASTGIGTSGHLCYEYMRLRTGGLKIDLVPFRTPAEVTKAVVSGVTQSASLYGGSGGPNDEITKALEGGARLLAITSEKRLPAWPNVPTFGEKGVDLVFSAWWGIGGPKGMPEKTVAVLKKALYKAVEDPQVRKVAESAGYQFQVRKEEEFTAFVKEYTKLIEMITREAKIPKM
jgi:tripartite-type tricarboxylate transporter receptor subunit TctC